MVQSLAITIDALIGVKAPLHNALERDPEIMIGLLSST